MYQKTDSVDSGKNNGNGLDWLARNLGYGGIDNLVNENGFESAQEMAQSQGFSTIEEYFHAPGYASRMDAIRKNQRQF